jgi:hypothetical protein
VLQVSPIQTTSSMITRPPASRAGLDTRLEHDCAGANLNDRERVHVAMWVDADHVVQLICKHPTHLQPRLGDTLTVFSARTRGAFPLRVARNPCRVRRRARSGG